MSGKIFVHIGLPKTATTTLQIDFFSRFASENIRYLGVSQPRTEKQLDAYKKLSAAVSTGLFIKETRTELMGLLNSSGTVILSEEAFTVSEESASWRAKLKNLSEILFELDYTIIITAREPTAAMFSYYVELFDQFSKKGKCFLDLAKDDESMHIYHYGKLTEAILQNFERDRIFIKKFEDIIAGGLDDLRRLIAPDESIERSIQLQKHNTKKKLGRHVFTGRRITLAALARRLLQSLGWLDASWVVKSKWLLSPIARGLSRISFYSEKRIVNATQEELNQLKEYLKEETAALEKEFGIRYE